MTISNALTIDVEDYFQVHAFSQTIRKDEWDSWESRVEKNTLRILDILDDCGEMQTENHVHGKKCHATFFILGWIAERHPGLVKEIHKRGHEVSCHGYAHQVIFSQTKTEFKRDVEKAKDILEDIVGEKVIGYRAPTYSITGKTLWALRILHELGFTYDSSIFPIKHDVYGFHQAPRFPFTINLDRLSEIGIKNARPASNGDKFEEPGTHSIVEFPISTARLFNYNLPVSGGGYFRLFPYPIIRRLLRRINVNEVNPFVFYIHPWEIDPDLPKVNEAKRISRFRTYVNLHKTEARFRRLLADFNFSSMSEVLSSCKARGGFPYQSK